MFLDPVRWTTPVGAWTTPVGAWTTPVGAWTTPVGAWTTPVGARTASGRRMDHSGRRKDRFRSLRSVDSSAVSNPRSFCVPLLLLVFALGCAAKQRVSLECVPRDVRVYVDGRSLDPNAESVALRPDRAHTLFFKGGGFEPQMLVLESHGAEGGARLSPAEVCSHTAFVSTSPRVEIQLAPESHEGAPGS